MCCAGCRCCKPDRDEPVAPTNDDEMPTGDEFFERFYSGDLITTNPLVDGSRMTWKPEPIEPSPSDPSKAPEPGAPVGGLPDIDD